MYMSKCSVAELYSKSGGGVGGIMVMLLLLTKTIYFSMLYLLLVTRTKTNYSPFKKKKQLKTTKSSD